MTAQSYVPPGLRFLLSAACLVIVVAGLRAASTILVPLALALFIAVASLPLLKFVRSKGTPTPLAILIVVLFDASALFLFGWLVRLASLEVSSEYGLYLTRLNELELAVVAWFAERGLEFEPISAIWTPQSNVEGAAPGGDVQRLFGIASFLLRGATDILTTVFLVVLIFIFMLAEAAKFGLKLRLIVGPEQLDRSGKIIKEIQHYLAIKTMISAATGLTIGVATWGLGLDFALLWGLLAFLLNYIPNVGSIIAAIPAVIVALLQIDPWAALLVAAVFIAVNALFGSFLEPMLVGRQLGISTLVIILSLVFWGWVWGPIGMFLAVPLTMALKIGLENSYEFKWLAVLMASEGRTAPAEAAEAAVVPALSSPPPAPLREKTTVL